jgi:hypothetical protein
MSVAVEINGIPGLAVRIGQALERWGSRAARPVSREELSRRRALQLVHDAAREARRDSVSGPYAVLR